MIYQPYTGIDALPSSLRIFGCSDYATMEPQAGKKEPDFTEHGCAGIDHRGDLWLLDWWFKQCETDVGIDNWMKMVKLWKPVHWFSEGSLIDKAIGPNIRAAMRKERKYIPYTFLPNIGDKGAKLEAFHGMAHAGCVHVPTRRPWVDHVLDQLVKFPGARWDDAADVCGLMGRAIDKVMPAGIPVVERRELLIPFTAAWIEYETIPRKPKVRYFS